MNFILCSEHETFGVAVLEKKKKNHKTNVPSLCTRPHTLASPDCAECKFHCTNGNCLRLGSLICNQLNNCGDNSDEENCPVVTQHPPPGIFNCEYCQVLPPPPVCLSLSYLTHTATGQHYLTRIYIYITLTFFLAWLCKNTFI